MNTQQHYMRTFFEFQEACSEEFPNETFMFRNWTNVKHAGWTDALYLADAGFTSIEYLQTRVWRFHFNDTTEEGPTLEEAIAGTSYDFLARNGQMWWAIEQSLLQ